MEKIIKAFCYLAFSVLGIAFGLKLHEYSMPFFLSLSPDLQIINKIMFAVLGFILGLTGGILTGNSVLRAIENTIRKILTIPLRQIIGGVAGLITGLIISSLVAFLFSYIPLRTLDYGGYIFSLLILIGAIFICYISIYLGTRIIGHMPVPRNPGANGHALDLLWGTRYKILDTSVIIDGRIYEIAKSGFIEGTIAVPRFVLTELQGVADSSEDLKRNKGRRGLDILDGLKKDFGIQIIEKDYPTPEVDGKLVDLAKDLQAVLITTDYNLNKTASLQGVEVMNINDLSNAVKPPILPGEEFKIRIIKEGKEPGQGVGYLDSGTMIVVENGKRYVGEEVLVEATSCLQTSAGRMIFVKVKQ